MSVLKARARQLPMGKAQMPHAEPADQYSAIARGRCARDCLALVHSGWLAIERITDYPMADMRHMHPDLMRAPGFQPTLDQRSKGG